MFTDNVREFDSKDNSKSNGASTRGSFWKEAFDRDTNIRLIRGTAYCVAFLGASALVTRLFSKS